VRFDIGFLTITDVEAQKAARPLFVRDPDHGGFLQKRWFRNGQRWRTGCEGRVSVSKRRHGLQRCRYRGEDGMGRWVGLGVIADNLINIGRAIAAKPAR
jgi:IS5 family transposase